MKYTRHLQQLAGYQISTDRQDNNKGYINKDSSLLISKEETQFTQNMQRTTKINRKNHTDKKIIQRLQSSQTRSTHKNRE
jgi:hypothetical protein